MMLKIYLIKIIYKKMQILDRHTKTTKYKLEKHENCKYFNKK